VVKGRWLSRLAATPVFAHEITVALDWVAQLGLYLEVEVVAPKSQIQQAHAGIRDFLRQWGLEGFAVEERSYIHLVASLT
jgi:adenylate cyclase class IV